jgi:hypothetical protein
MRRVPDTFDQSGAVGVSLSEKYPSRVDIDGETDKLVDLIASMALTKLKGV